jgi:hypothetical protein
MKVTKLIREYVTDEVSKVYDAKVNPYSEQAKIDKEKIEAFAEELRKRQHEDIKKFAFENDLLEETWRNSIRPYEVATSIPSFHYACTQSMLDEKKWREENTKAKNAKVRDIIISLELGATRHELNDMLAELLKEE